MNYKRFVVGVVTIIILLVVWYSAVIPRFVTNPDDLNYNAELISMDNFYDEASQHFAGPVLTKSIYSMKVLSEENANFIIKNTFDVKTVAGENIFSVSRIYGVSRVSGMHVTGYGDKDRDGYLFAPKNLKPNQSFTYWHINYDAPAEMEFKEETIIHGLKVYKYEEDYTVDQTDYLGHLAGVPEERGVINEINLQIWIEPILGRMIQYQDTTLASYYDIATHEYLHPWNNFSNKFTSDTVTTQVIIAQNKKFELLLIKIIFPVLFALIMMLITLFISMRKK